MVKHIPICIMIWRMTPFISNPNWVLILFNKYLLFLIFSCHQQFKDSGNSILYFWFLLQHFYSFTEIYFLYQTIQQSQFLGPFYTPLQKNSVCSDSTFNLNPAIWQGTCHNDQKHKNSNVGYSPIFTSFSSCTSGQN